MNISNELIAEYKTKWFKLMTTPSTLEEVTAAINSVWSKGAVYGKNPRKIIICDSPKACQERAEYDGFNLDNMYQYFSLWTVSYTAPYELAFSCGAEFDVDKLNEFINWAKHCHYVLFDENNDTVYVSQNPTHIRTNIGPDGTERTHNENGLAVEYGDGWGVYAINGVHLDEQIVMRPETQTIEQIQAEQNEEARLIRIERFGYEKYLEAINAQLIDENRNDIEGTLEFLFEGKDMTVLLTRCPSTGKRFSLRVPTTIKTCRGAQYWLSSGLSRRIISAS